MKVKLLHNSSLEVVVKAIRKCYASEGKSDSSWRTYDYDNLEDLLEPLYVLGPKDKALIKRIIESDHTSTLEHLTFSFDIDGLSRAALQELARHRHASLSVKSTRYTLGELRDCRRKEVEKLFVKTGVPVVDASCEKDLQVLRLMLQNVEVTNDKAKYLLPESFKTSLICSLNARSLRNFLKLRSSKRALWEMRELAEEVFNNIPEDIKFIFEDCMEEL